jgi:hypothetical protein
MSIDVSLVTFEYAKIHVKPASSRENDDLQMKLFEATQVIMNHCKLTEIPEAWFTSEIPPAIDDEFVPQAMDISQSPPVVRGVIVPGNISTAIMLHTSELFYNRESSNAKPLSEFVLSLLEGFRTPTLA